MGTLLVRGILAVTLLLTVVFPAWAQDSKGVGVWQNSVQSTFSGAPSGYSTIQQAGSQPLTVVKPAP